MLFQLELGPRERWQLRVDVVPSLSGAEVHPVAVERHFGAERDNVRRSLATWQLSIPRLRAESDDLRQAFRQSVADLAALRMRTADGLEQAARGGDAVVHDRLRARHADHEPADDAARARARDRLARGARGAAGAGGRRLDRRRAGQDPARAPPGPSRRDVVRHLLRDAWTRRRSSSSCSRRRGAGPRTPSSSSGCAGPRSPRSAGSTSTATATRTASSSTSGERRAGSRTSRGRTPATRSASTTARSRGRRSRRRRCRATSTTPSSGSPSSRGPSGTTCRSRSGSRPRRPRCGSASTTRYWVEERGGYYALALDADKRPVDSLCSNLGHLLWSGIVPPERVETIANRLLGEELWSGWGIRTMSTADAAYNPLSYHNGTVWPHDTSLGAWGLARAGRAGRRVDDRERPARGGALLRLVAAGGVRGLQAQRDAVPDRLSDRGAAAGLGGRHADPAAAAAARARARPGERASSAPPRRRCPSGSTVSSSRACARSGAPGTSLSQAGA